MPHAITILGDRKQKDAVVVQPLLLWFDACMRYVHVCRMQWARVEVNFLLLETIENGAMAQRAHKMQGEYSEWKNKNKNKNKNEWTNGVR